MVLDLNIKNNLFRAAGAVGSNVLSAKAAEAIKESLFDKIGENNIISARGFLGSQLSSVIRRLLFTRDGAHGVYDPVWKLASYYVRDESTGEIGSPFKVAPGELAGANHPKYKFNYTVALEYRKAINDQLDGPSDPRRGSTFMSKMYFSIKTASRPNPTVNLQDINFYNYRTKVATKVDYGTMTLTFYDDNQNTAHDIYEMYLKSLSPIANVNNTIFADFFDSLGINNPSADNPDVSSVGALPIAQEAGLINSITVVQHLPLNYDAARMSQNGSPSFVDGTKIQARVVEYVFMNPKIINMTLDDLDMTVSDVSTVTLSFAYDSVYINKATNQYDPLFETATNQLTEIDPTGDRINQLGILDNLSNAFNQGVTQLGNNTLLSKVKDFII